MDVPYKLSLEMDLEMSSNISSIHSPTHVIHTKIDGKIAKLRFAEKELLNRDFDLYIQLAKLHTPNGICEISDNKAEMSKFKNGLERTSYPDGMAVMLSFFPKIDFTRDISSELIFLIDRYISHHHIFEILYQNFLIP
jgi:hypothetical protein